MSMITVMRAVLVAAALPTAVSAQSGAARDTFFNSGGVPIRYLDQGQGSAVVLLHGYTGTADRHWVNTGVMEKLAGSHRVIALDLRGHGRSGKPHDATAYGAEMGRDVLRLLDHLRIRRAHIVGFSLGAIIAGRLVTDHPDRFLSVTFAAHHPVWQWRAADDRAAEASARELEGDTPFRSLVVALSPPDSVPSDDEIRRFAQPLVARNDVKALAALQRGRVGGTLAVSPAQLRQLRVPALAIIGSADPSVGATRALKTVMPAADTVIVDGATHGGERGLLRRPEFIEALSRFLAAHDAPRRQ